MNKKYKIFWTVIFITIIAGVIFQVTKHQPTEEEAREAEGPIVIGGIIPLTGNGAAYGLPIQRSALIALDEINASGGINGRTVEIIWEDGKCESEDASAAAQKLVNVDNVKIIIGGVCSSELLAIAPVTEPAGVIVISPSATSPDVTTAGDFIFRTAPSDALAGKIAAEYAFKNLEAKKVAIISENKNYTQSLRNVFKETYEKFDDVEVVADEQFETDATSFKDQIKAVKEANPDLIYLLPQTPESGQLLIKEINENKLEAQLLTAEVLMGREVIAENKEEIEGLIGVEGFFDEKSAKNFLDKYKDQTDEVAPFPFYMANMHGQLFLLKDAIESQGVDTIQIKDYLLSLKDWQGTMGSLTFDANGDPLSTYVIKQVKDGELVELEVKTSSI